MTQITAKKEYIKDEQGNYIVPYVNPASTTEAGIVKIDGSTIVLDSNGAIKADGYTNKVSKTGDTMTGQLVINKENSMANSGIKLTGSKQNYAISILDTSITKGTAPSDNKLIGIDIYGKDNDNYNKRLGMLELKLQPDNTCSFGIYAYNCTTNTNTANSKIEALVDGNGNAYTYAPTPTVSDNSTKIATTEYVQSNLSSKANDNEVVHSSGNETIAGTKTFSSSVMSTANMSYVCSRTSGDTFVCKAMRTDQNEKIEFGIAPNGNTRGIYDEKTAKWLISLVDDGTVKLYEQEAERVKTKYKNGASWYRVFQDNWCIQGTTTSLSDGSSFTFLKAFTDTNYTILAAPLGYPTNQSDDKNWLAFPLSKSTTSCTFRVWDSDGNVSKTGNVNIIAFGFVS